MSSNLPRKLKFIFHWNLSRITDTSREAQHSYMITSRSFLLEWEMCQTKFVQKIKTHVLCSVTSFPPKIVPFMRQCGKTERCRLQMAIRRMRISIWIPKAPNTLLKICNIYSFFRYNNGCTHAPHCCVIRTLPFISTVFRNKTIKLLVLLMDVHFLWCRKKINFFF